MVIKELKLKNFRNYSDLKIKLNPHINIIYGNNAQGKTNLLESIYVLPYLHIYYSTKIAIIKENKVYYPIFLFIIFLFLNLFSKRFPLKI